jgi:UDP-N-acetylglucosamine 2-epimerase
MIHVFIGTKAQYIKTAPLLRLMDERAVPYRLIDSGQHAALARDLRTELGVRAPDHVMGGDRDVTTIPQAIGWAAGLAAKLVRGAQIRHEVFGGLGGVCVVHGDTPSTLLSTLMARRAGLDVAHLEAGLRSRRVFHPFPEELIRIVVMRLATTLFAPDAEAVANLARMRVKGRVVPLEANTSVEAVRQVEIAADAMGPAIVTMHRVENLHRRNRVEGFVDLVERMARNGPVRFVLHEPTRAALAKHDLLARLTSAGVELVPLAPHGEFVRMLAAAPLVVTDGGSIQEECALLGVPTLLWRDRSERPNGIGANVVVSRYERSIVDRFLAESHALRGTPDLPDVNPSQQILDVLTAA